MEGVINKIWENQDPKGNRYVVLDISGERYSLWYKDQMDGLTEGQRVEYEWKQSGKYRNITKLELVGEEPVEHDRVGVERGRDRLRLRCVESASRVLAHYDADPEQKGQFVLELARRLERYITEADE